MRNDRILFWMLILKMQYSKDFLKYNIFCREYGLYFVNNFATTSLKVCWNIALCGVSGKLFLLAQGRLLPFDKFSDLTYNMLNKTAGR